MRWRDALTAALVAPLAAGCLLTGAGAAPCADVTGERLAPLLGRQADADALSEAVRGDYAIRNLQILSSAEVDGDGRPLEQTLLWSAGGQGYALEIEGGAVASASVTYDGLRRPAVGRLVECLGPPDLYRAWYTPDPVAGHKLGLLLLYPARGIAVEVASFNRFLAVPAEGAAPLAFDPATAATAIMHTAPAPAEELVARLLYWGPERRGTPLWQWYIDNLKPWPGSWDQVEISTEPRPGSQ